MKRRFALLLLLLSALPMPADARGYALHGNWCGPVRPGPFAPPPVDPLDAACMRHAICIARRGPVDCGCDIALMQTLRRTSWPRPAIATRARVIHDRIAVTPCANPSGMAFKAGTLASDMMLDIMTGREAPANIMRRWMIVAASMFAGIFPSP